MSPFFPTVEVLPSERNQIILSVNPKAGRRSSKAKADQLAEALRKGGMEVEILTDLATVARKANELHQAGQLRALIGLGIDKPNRTRSSNRSPSVRNRQSSGQAPEILFQASKICRNDSRRPCRAA